MTAPIGSITHPDDIKSFADISGIVETQQTNQPVFATYWKIYENGDAYVAIVPKSRLDTKIEEVIPALQRVPDEKIYPDLSAGVELTILPSTWASDVNIFTKRPSFMWIEDGDYHWIRNIFLAEAKIVEQISRAPHKNIAQYYGCYQRDGRLTGIALRRYEYTLVEYFQKACGNLAVED
ncbi:hypothetical protein TruAng_001272 [Truncatella angustata]|nr:hypothetical protein TruAng_001272 [Truncatella angustata]